MDSQRSGLLSTLLMTLPLIVVPAIALLRPPGWQGVSTTLDAQTSDEETDLSDLFPDDESDSESGNRRPTSTADTDDVFREITDGSPTARGSRTAEHDEPADAAETDPFATEMPSVAESPSSSRRRPVPESEPAADSSAEIEEQLHALGALRTYWFEASGQTPVGLAVFFRGQTELTRIRFEAVGATREDCARSVFEQVSRWRNEQARLGP